MWSSIPIAATSTSSAIPTGNLEIVYAAIAGRGVFMSPNAGQVWNQMLGQGGNPQVQDAQFPPEDTVPVACARQ